MNRHAPFVGLFILFAGTVLAADKDTPLAANTRSKKLSAKVTVDFQDQLLRECFAEISKQLEDAGAGSLSIKYDTGISMNQRVSYKGKDEALEKVLDGMLKKASLGYIVISKSGDRYDGWLLVKQGPERGYPAGEEAKSKAKSLPTKDKSPPKIETPPASDDEKAEKTAASKLDLARSLLKDGKSDRAKQRLQEIVEQFPKTKAAMEAQKELAKLK